MLRTLTYRILSATDGQTILHYLKSLGYSGPILVHLKKTDHGTLLNGVWAHMNETLHTGDLLCLHLEENTSGTSIFPQQIPLAICYEDEDLLVIDKPAGMPVHPSAAHQRDTLANAVTGYYRAKGEIRPFRCINRLDYGKKYCHHSPTMEEAPLQNAIMDAVLKTAQIDPNILQTLKQHIRLGLGAGAGEDKSVEIQIRIAQIDQEFKSLLNSVTAENQQELLTDPRITDLMTEKRQLEKELAEYAAAEQHRQNTASRLDNIFTILDGMKNHPLTYDDAVIRQILQCVIVESKEKIKVVFIGGMEVKTEGEP